MKKYIIITVCFLMLFAVSCKKPPEDTVKPNEIDIKTLFNTVCTGDEAIALAKENHIPVRFGSTCVCGLEKMEEFYAAVCEKKPASILTAAYYDTESGIGHDLFFCYVEYDGDAFSVKVRQSDVKEPEEIKTYKYLKKYTGEHQPLIRRYVYYCLVNDENVEWEDIERGMVSSQSGTWVDHETVFSDLTGMAYPSGR